MLDAGLVVLLHSVHPAADRIPGAIWIRPSRDAVVERHTLLFRAIKLLATI